MNAPNREIRRGRKYDQVLAGARDVFLRDGFEGASVDDIAREAKVSKATLYNYFADKRQLFMEMVRAECQRQATDMLREIDLNEPVQEVLRHAGLGMLTLLSKGATLRIFRICAAEADRFPELGRDFYESGPLMGRQRLAEFLTCAATRGEVNIEDFQFAAAQFQELCKADLFLQKMFGVRDEFSRDEIEAVIENAVDMFMARYGTGS